MEDGVAVSMVNAVVYILEGTGRVLDCETSPGPLGGGAKDLES